MGADLAITVEKRSVYDGRKRSVYDATCGKLTAGGFACPAHAKTAMAEKVARFLDSYGSPVALWSLDGRDVYLAFPTPDGWAYTISDAARKGNAPHLGGSLLWGSCGPFDSREECLSRMRSHWYDGNARDIVEGIIGLCTDMRLWVCAACHSVSRSGAPYVCRNPACGAVAPAFDW